MPAPVFADVLMAGEPLRARGESGLERRSVLFSTTMQGRSPT